MEGNKWRIITRKRMKWCSMFSGTFPYFLRTRLDTRRLSCWKMPESFLQNSASKSEIIANPKMLTMPCFPSTASSKLKHVYTVNKLDNIYIYIHLSLFQQKWICKWWISDAAAVWFLESIKYFHSTDFSWLAFSWLLEERTGTPRITKQASLLCHSMSLLWRTKTFARDCPCASTVHFLHHGSYKHDHVLVGNGCPLWNITPWASEPVFPTELAWIDLIYDTSG